MLNKSKSAGYKALAKRAKIRECMVSDDPLSEVVVDIRSRVFMYIRRVYLNTPLKERIDGLFRAIGNIEKEKERVLCAAIAMAKMEVSMMRVRKATYVFGSATPCPFKGHLRSERNAVARIRLAEFRGRTREFMSDMLNTELLGQCIAALESYMVSDLEGVCTMHRGNEWLLVPGASYSVASKADMFESDRTCAKLGKLSAVLSEDLDCVALFGANFMVKEVHRGFFSYTTLKDVMEVFNSDTRENLAEKCCLMGTDYNFGLKGVGPVKVQKIDARRTSELCSTCLSAQSIKAKEFRGFLMLQ